TALTLNSTIYLAHRWFGGQLLGSWWGTQVALWLAMTLVTLLATFWATRRHADDEAPSRTEAVVLGLLSLSCLAGVIWCLVNSSTRPETTLNLLLTLSLGVWTGALYQGFRRIAAHRGGSQRPGLPTEAVILWAALIAFTGFAAARPGAQPMSTETDPTG